MKIAVKDANILIDMLEGGFLDLWFSLCIETVTTRMVVNEVTQPEQRRVLEAFVRSRQLLLEKLDDTAMEEIAGLLAAVGGVVTIQDCSVLHVAIKRDAMLLSGDAKLRKVAKDRHVEVHGTLWVMDLLVDRGVLRPAVAAEKLQRLLDGKRRLPRQECERRIRGWTRGESQAVR